MDIIVSLPPNNNINWCILLSEYRRQRERERERERERDERDDRERRARRQRERRVNNNNNNNNEIREISKLVLVWYCLGLSLIFLLLTLDHQSE